MKKTLLILLTVPLFGWSNPLLDREYSKNFIGPRCLVGTVVVYGDTFCLGYEPGGVMHDRPAHGRLLRTLKKKNLPFDLAYGPPDLLDRMRLK